jgi:hypothetical protein
VALLVGRPSWIPLLEYVYQQFHAQSFVAPLCYVRDLQGAMAHEHDIHRYRLIVQAIDFEDLLRTQYLLKSPTGKSTE